MAMKDLCDKSRVNETISEMNLGFLWLNQIKEMFSYDFVSTIFILRQVVCWWSWRDMREGWNFQHTRIHEIPRRRITLMLSTVDVKKKYTRGNIFLTIRLRFGQFKSHLLTVIWNVLFLECSNLFKRKRCVRNRYVKIDDLNRSLSSSIQAKRLAS